MTSLVFMPKAVRTAGEVPLFGEGVPLALGDQPAAAPLAASAPYVAAMSSSAPPNAESVLAAMPSRGPGNPYLFASPEPDPLPEKPSKSTSNTRPR
jgi:hypothetical protein